MADIRLALRTLAKNRGFAAVALLTIALGVGANAAVFSVVNATLIQPLPYADSERLVAVFETARRASVERRAVSYPNFRDWQREARSFEAMSVAFGERVTMTFGDAPERVNAELVSPGYFEMLGVRPVRGRGFTDQDNVPGAPRVIVISDALWLRSFAGDPQIVGRAVRINAELSTVVGVMPPTFGGIVDAPVLWAPVERFTGADIVNERGQRSIDLVVARLAPGVTLEQARVEMDAIAGRLDRMYPSPVGERGAAIQPLRDEFFGGPMKGMLLVLLGAVGFVLLIACVNVASLLLARGVARQGEIALRCALGASRRRIVRQMIMESLVLSGLGGVVGLAAGFFGVDMLVGLSPVPFPDFLRVDVDLRVLAFTFAICLAGGLLAGAAPAIVASRTNLLAALSVTGRDASSSSTLLRRGLVTVEIALALVLLVGAGLMLRTIDRLMTIDAGFTPRGLVTMRLAVPAAITEAGMPDERLAVFTRTLLDRVRALPGVATASLSSDVPLGTSASATTVRIEGRDTPAIRVYRHAVSPGHFRNIRARLLQGRDFTDDDGRTGSARVAIVSRAMATRYFPAGDALRSRIRRGDDLYEVVGVVGDLRHRDLVEAASADPDIYFPIYQVPSRALAVMARTTVEGQSPVAAIRQTVAELDRGVAVFQIETGDQLLGRQTSPQRLSGTLLGAFALVALALTLIGIYGVTAYAVGRQTRQLGIRIALGATRGDILRLVLSSGMVFIAAGLALGTCAALGLTRLLGALIYGVSAADPMTFATVIGLLLLMAVLACLVPAVRATRIEPLAALRAD
jgi:putative ABC transport system permease protein